MNFDWLTDLVGINHCTFDGSGHGYVTDLMHWLLNEGVICVHRDPKYLLHFSKILCTISEHKIFVHIHS